MDSRNYPGCSGRTFHKKRHAAIRKLRSIVMAVLQVVRLRKSMRRLCLDPPAAGVEAEPKTISIGPRKDFHPYVQYDSRPHLKLKFSNNITGPIYTGLPIGGDHNSILNLDLVDSGTENIITSGSEASTKVEILALDKDYNIVSDKSLIRGDPHVTLKDGSVSVSHISFKHTNVPMRKRELRLCARAATPSAAKIILEAVTEPFIVKDRRSMSKSQRPLTLDDEVWKLQMIGKASRDRLKKQSITTVRDFLTKYFLNREMLIRILGRRMHIKKLGAAVNQAKGKLDLKRHLYPSGQEQNLRVEYTEVGEVIGVYQETGQFLSVEHLTGSQKATALDLVKAAIQNITPCADDGNSKMLCSSSELSLEAYLDTEQQELPSVNYVSTTNTIYDSMNQINSCPIHNSEGPDLLPYDNLMIDYDQDQYDSLWDC